MTQSKAEGEYRSKTRYLDILELAWQAYGRERIEKRLTADGTGYGSSFHSLSGPSATGLPTTPFPRLHALQKQAAM